MLGTRHVEKKNSLNQLETLLFLAKLLNYIVIGRAKFV